MHKLNYLKLTKNTLLSLLIVMSLCSSHGCYEATIQTPIPFMGNHGEIFKLSDGTLWQVQHEYECLCECNPNVVICPAEGKILINGKSLSVSQLSGYNQPINHGQSIIESHIDGDFEGWEGETIFKLSNGQIWQQDSYSYTYHYAYRPEVLIFQKGGAYHMSVKGVSNTIKVRRLK